VLIVHPNSVIGNDGLSKLWKLSTSNISRLLDNLNKLIDSYFQSEFDLSDFRLNRIDFAVDIEVKNGNSVSDYIKVLHNIGRVKCFSPINYKHNRIKKDDCFALEGNTNGVEFWAYKLKDEEETGSFANVVGRDEVRKKR
jgi:hypothetical protein